MSDFVIAQAIGDYVGLSSLVETARQTFNVLVSRAQDVEFTTWLIVAGVVLVVTVFWGIRPPH